MKEKKRKAKTLTEKVEILKAHVKRLEKSIGCSDVTMGNLRKKIGIVENRLRAFIDKKTAEIRVFEKDGEWGGYTGVFYVNSKDAEDIITEKAMNHYNTYFEGDDFYKKRTLGLFITNPNGKKLIKVLQDNENKLTD